MYCISQIYKVALILEFHFMIVMVENFIYRLSVVICYYAHFVTRIEPIKSLKELVDEKAFVVDSILTSFLNLNICNICQMFETKD